MPSCKTLITAVVAMITVGTLAGCSSGGPIATPTPVPGASSNGSLNIGISFDQPGIGLKDGDTYSGFDVDTAIYVAQALGVPKENITWVEADPGDRQQLLIDKKVDLIFSSYSITEDRKKVIDFAGPYFVAHQDLLVRLNEEEITGPETLDGRKLCSVTGTTSAAYINQTYRGKIELVERPIFSDCVAALADSEVDAVTTDDVILAGFAAEPQYQGKLKVIGKGFTEERYGVGIQKGNTALVTQVNEALTQYIADGSWKNALGNTVGKSDYEIPDPPTPGTA